MTMPRAHLVDPTVTRWYHCVTRCVRRAFLLGDPEHDRKSWIDQRLKELAEIFAVSVAAFSVMDNHLHVLVRLDPEVAGGWTDEEVVRRWGRLFPPRDRSRKPLPVSDEWVQGRLKDAEWVATARRRLQSLSWSMKCLKEPLSRLANAQDDCRGAFFEGRFRSVGILDEESLLAICAYIDLNPVAAGLVDVPEASPHTSIKERVDHVKDQERCDDLEASRRGSVAGSEASSGLEDALWLCPVEDRRPLDSTRGGMLEGSPLGSYLLLVDYSSRLFREGKATVAREVSEIFDRLGSSAETWRARLEGLRKGRLLGRFVAASRSCLEEVAVRLGQVRVVNLNGCPAV